jgi:phage baseplate assembly protein W
MATYIGFSTQHVNEIRQNRDTNNTGVNGGLSLNSPMKSKNKFRTIDEELVIQDFINALNIHQGSKPGNPAYGTSLWSFIFEPNTDDIRLALEEEIQRVASLDPRLVASVVNATPFENGIALSLQVYVQPFNDLITISVFFDQTKSFASITA